MNSITYSDVEFPRSQEDVRPPLSRFAATDWIKTCDLVRLVTIGRPADEVPPCPSPGTRVSLAAAIAAFQDGNADVISVRDGCIAAAEHAPPDYLL